MNVIKINLAFWLQEHYKCWSSTLFSSNVPLLYPLKTSENRKSSNIFRGYRSGTLIENGLTANYHQSLGKIKAKLVFSSSQKQMRD